MSTGTGGGSRRSLKPNKSASSKGDHSGNMQTVMAPVKSMLTSTFKLPGPGKEESFENFLQIPDAQTKIKLKEAILFSKSLKKSRTDPGETDLEFFYKYEAPEVQAPALTDNTHRPGFVPVSTAFHMQSNRERIDDDDDGLDDSDLFAADGIIRRPVQTSEAAKKKSMIDGPKVDRRMSKRHSFIHESIKLIKGDFMFPHRTYRPKVQVAFRVPPGQMPQAVVIERLHRVYRRTDIGVLCAMNGITQLDLMAVPHYGEHNERFYQEMQWRNRIRVNGVDKREYVEQFYAARTDPMKAAAARSKAGQSSYGYDTRDKDQTPGESDYYDELMGEDAGHAGDFVKPTASRFDSAEAAPPFGPMFPLDYFDNEEYDIRTGEEWMFLGWDWKEHRMYPIPAKAYLPVRRQLDESVPEKCKPLLEKEKPKALSEMTAVNLLTKTERLEKFRHWLLTERYRRLTNDDASAGLLNEKELLAFARRSTTVPHLIPITEEESLTETATRASIQSDSSDVSNLSITKIFPEDKEGAAESMKDSASYMDLEGNDSDFWTQFKKAERKKQEGGGGGGGAQEETKNEVEEVKRSESLLPDVFSDPDSFPTSPPAGASKEVQGTKTKSEAAVKTPHTRNDTKSVLMEEDTEGPGSPDIDPYEDGGEDLVFDYDKMKRVHNYDWQWLEVAVFKYDPETRRYFVRTIYPPIIFAWLSKLYVVMDGEDPRVHCERLKEAIHRRHEVENIMRYNLYIDCLPTDRVKGISVIYLRKVLLKILDTPRLEYKESTLKRVQQEVDLEYQRTHLMLEFNNIVEKHPKLYQPWVKIPEPFVNWGNGSEWKKSKSWHMNTGSFTYKKTRIQKISVMYMTEPYEGLMEINALCLDAKERRMLLSRTKTATRLDDFEQAQGENIKEVMEFMRDQWMEDVMAAIRRHLSKIPHSWYNINETRWDVYLMSKTCNYLTLAKFMMETTLRHVTETSLAEFVSEIDELTGKIDIDLKYDWGDDLINSEFPPPEGLTPPFLLELFMDKDGPKYTQLLSKFPKIINLIFENCIASASTLPDIVPQIMTNLLFGVSRRLNSVTIHDPHIRRLNAALLRGIRKGLYPVDKYAQKYRKYQEIFNLDLPKFLKQFERESKTATDVRKVVEKHQAEYNQLEEEIPTTLDIACFRIDCEVVRTGLLKKKKSMVTGLLDQFAEKLRNQVHKIRDEYADMERKLNNRSEDIHEVMELKVYVETVPGQVQMSMEQMNRIMKDYDMFERFSYTVPNDDFENKWNTALWATRILKIADDAVGWLDDDYDRLLKVQTADMSALSDAVDSATLAVSGLAAFVELERAVEVSQEVRKVWKQVLELEDQNRLLNIRQEIFGLPSTQNEALERLIRDIEPFKSLWFTAADYQRLQEVLYKETLDKIDVRAVNRLINEGGQVIRKCVRYFKGADTIQHIAEEVQHHIDEFRPIVPLITTLKNNGMRQRHWEAISDAVGFRVVAKGNQNFKALLDQGLGQRVAEIAAIGDLATHEFAIESKLEKMLKDLDKIKLAANIHPGTGVVIFEMVPSKGMSVLDTFIVTTMELQENPYRTPFEERLNSWEKKLHLTTENLQRWFDNQKEWVELQPHFSTPDAATRMPPEFKMFQKMERIWRRLGRVVRDKPDILDIGSDSTVRASLLQFMGLIEKVKKGLEEYMRPHGSSSDDDVPNQ